MKKETRITLEDFQIFLLRRNALRGFVKNVFTPNSFVFACELFKIRPPECWLSSSFLWASSPQGREYWSKINDAWQCYIRRFK